MTTQKKLIRNKLSLLWLAEYLKNVSEACKINGVSRQHFYDIKKAYDEEGLEVLRGKNRRKPCMFVPFQGRCDCITAAKVLGMVWSKNPPLTMTINSTDYQLFLSF